MQGKHLRCNAVFVLFLTALCPLTGKDVFEQTGPLDITDLKVDESSIYTTPAFHEYDPEQAFADPPPCARPRVFWWWLNSMATKESITRDLEELKAKGFGGAMVFDAGSSNYSVAHKTPAGPVFGSRKWKELFLHALKEADRLGLEISLNIQSGWNPGGPSVTPRDAMKKLVRSEVRVTGPATFSQVLPQPAGSHYQDYAVQAFKLAEKKTDSTEQSFTITASSAQSSHPPSDAIDFSDDTWWVSQNPPSKKAPQWIQIESREPVTLSSLHITGRKDYGPRTFSFLYANDGTTFSKVGTYQLKNSASSKRISFPHIKARFFRIEVTAAYDRGEATAAPRNVQIATLNLGKGTQFRERKRQAPIKHFGYKSLTRQFRGWGNYPLHYLREQYDSPEEIAITNEADVAEGSIVLLTDKLRKDGTLNWTVPAGKWVIVRFGYVPTGAHVSTSSDGWGGLSFDHLSTRALRNYLSDVVDPILAYCKPYVGKSLKYLHTDSWEMGLTNWTDRLPEEFKLRCGYSMVPYLPVLTGRIVKSRDASNRFLRDYRRTVSDCIADRMYGVFALYAHKHKLLIHPESGGPHSAPIEALKCLGRNDVPMGEFWARANTHRVPEGARLFLKQSSSAAHIYGKRFVAGEGPTTIGPQWERAPKDLKNVFDRNFCEGINRFFWHCFTSSPKEFGLPGNEYFAGTHLNPNTTWWNKSKAWADYLSRCSYLLSEGLFQADVCIYYGDDSPNFVPRKHAIDGLGPGYDYDVCNAEVILKRMAVKDGSIVLPDGMKYRLLVLPEREAISLPVLRTIEKLVQAGATVAGPRPKRPISLAGFPNGDRELTGIAGRLWGDCDGKERTENKYGKGRVFWGKPLGEILESDGAAPDFTFKSSQENAQIDYIHRRAGDTDIYFVVNRLARHGIYDTKYRYMTDLPDRYETVECTFRVTGKAPELWNPMTGRIARQPVYRQENGRTSVLLHLPPEGSMFVVFRNKPEEEHIVTLKHSEKTFFPVSSYQSSAWPKATVHRSGGKLYLEAFTSGTYTVVSSSGKTALAGITVTPALPIEGPWEVHFPPGWGAPETASFPELISWTESAVSAIKYFSGTATYRKEFQVPVDFPHWMRVYLDLGNVQELADITFNGSNLGVAWIAPYRVEITKLLKRGKNLLEIDVTNLWPNRLIGDQFLPEEKRYTQTNIKKFTKQSPLRVSGLLGPVRLVLSQNREIRFSE